MGNHAWAEHGAEREAGTTSGASAPAPGRRTLTMQLPARGSEREPVAPAGEYAAVDPEQLRQLMDAAVRPDLDAHAPLPAGGGASLPGAVHRQMESAFGADLSAVRIHEGPHAAAMGAVAFTSGNDLHFQPGRYDPWSAAGKELLGHELTHVLQQRGGEASTQAKGVHVDGDRGLETQADDFGARVARGERVDLAQIAPARGGGLQCVLESGKPKDTRVTIEIKPGVFGKGVIDKEVGDEQKYLVKVSEAPQPFGSLVGKTLKFEYGKLTEIVGEVEEQPVEKYQPQIEDKQSACLEFLHQTRARARESFQLIRSPHESLGIMRTITHDVDQLLRDVHVHALQEVAAKHFKTFGGIRYAFIALGSYGRGEMSTHSDIDLGMIFESSKDRQDVLGNLRFLLMAMEERIKALDESYVPKDNDQQRGKMGLRFDTAGMTPFGGNSGAVTNSPNELARNMIPNNPDAPRQGEDKMPVSAPTNALLDARYIAMPNSDPELFRKFALAQEQCLDERYDGPERDRLGPTNRDATAKGLFQKAQPVLLLCKEVIESQRSAMNVKTNLRQALDWTTSGLAHLARVPKSVSGTYERLGHMLAQHLFAEPSLGRAMRDGVAWVATRRIQSHLHHDDERDVYRTGYSPGQVGTIDEKGKEGHESRNGLETDLVLNERDLGFLRDVIANAVDPLLDAVGDPSLLINNPFGDSIEQRTRESQEYREYLQSRNDEI